MKLARLVMFRTDSVSIAITESSLGLVEGTESMLVVMMDPTSVATKVDSTAASHHAAATGTEVITLRQLTSSRSRREAQPFLFRRSRRLTRRMTHTSKAQRF